MKIVSINGQSCVTFPTARHHVAARRSRPSTVRTRRGAWAERRRFHVDDGRLGARGTRNGNGRMKRAEGKGRREKIDDEEGFGVKGGGGVREER